MAPFSLVVRAQDTNGYVSLFVKATHLFVDLRGNQKENHKQIIANMITPPPKKKQKQKKTNTSLRAIPTLHTHDRAHTCVNSNMVFEWLGAYDCSPSFALRALSGIHWRAALAGYSAGSNHEPLWRDTRRDPLASRSGGILGSTHEPLWRDTRRDPLASSSGGILGGIHWRAALAEYWAGSTGEQLWRDTRRDPLASSSGGTLGGIHWRAALAGYWVGAWCRSIANADSNVKSNNPFLSGGEQKTPEPS